MATPQYLPLDSTDFQKFFNNNILYDLLEHDIKGFQKKLKAINIPSNQQRNKELGELRDLALFYERLITKSCTDFIKII